MHTNVSNSWRVPNTWFTAPLPPTIFMPFCQLDMKSPDWPRRAMLWHALREKTWNTHAALSLWLFAVWPPTPYTHSHTPPPPPPPPSVQSCRGGLYKRFSTWLDPESDVRCVWLWKKQFKTFTLEKRAALCSLKIGPYTRGECMGLNWKSTCNSPSGLWTNDQTAVNA